MPSVLRRCCSARSPSTATASAARLRLYRCHFRRVPERISLLAWQSATVGALAGKSGLSCKQPLAYAGRVGDIFKALADPTRRAILDELTDRDGQTLFELCTRLIGHGFGSTRQAVSQHLDVLEDAGLITTRRQGRYKFHHLDTEPLNVIVQRWLTYRPTEGRKEHP